jgi:hypothetical protein
MFLRTNARCTMHVSMHECMYYACMLVCMHECAYKACISIFLLIFMSANKSCDARTRILKTAYLCLHQSIFLILTLKMQTKSGIRECNLHKKLLKTCRSNHDDCQLLV